MQLKDENLLSQLKTGDIIYYRTLIGVKTYIFDGLYSQALDDILESGDIIKIIRPTEYESVYKRKKSLIYPVNCYTCQHCQQDTCKGCRTILTNDDEPYENWELREDLQEKDEKIAELKKVAEEMAGQLVAIYEHENYTYGDHALNEDFPKTLTKYGNREDPVVIEYIIKRYTDLAKSNKEEE